MTKKEVIERFYQLSTEVGDFFDSKFSYDCFCDKEGWGWGVVQYNFQFDGIIIEFIEQCVREKMFATENQQDEIDGQIAKLQLIKELKKS